MTKSDFIQDRSRKIAPISNIAILIISFSSVALHFFEFLPISDFFPFFVCILMIQQSSQVYSNFRLMFLSLIPYVFLFQILFTGPSGFDVLFLTIMGLIWGDFIDENTTFKLPIIFLSSMISFSVLLSLLLAGPHFGSLFCLLISMQTYFKNLEVQNFHLSYQFTVALLAGCVLSLVWNPGSPAEFFFSKSAESSLVTNIGGLIFGCVIFRFFHETYGKEKNVDISIR